MTRSRTVSALVALSLSLSGASAGALCAEPQDVTALKTADLQQFLMVAALTCKKVSAYNSFVTSHRSELQQSDRRLLRYFVGRNARTGDGDYHAYKTALANGASLRSLHDPQFCREAEAAFDAATGRPVAGLVEDRPPPAKIIYTSCPSAEPLIASSGQPALDLR